MAAPEPKHQRDGASPMACDASGGAIEMELESKHCWGARRALCGGGAVGCVDRCRKATVCSDAYAQNSHPLSLFILFLIKSCCTIQVALPTNEALNAQIIKQ